MENALLTALVGVVGIVVGSVITAGLAARNSRTTEDRALLRGAADEILTALGAVRDVVRRSLPANSIESADVAAAVIAWGDAMMRREDQLHSDARHIRRSIVDALAEHFGIAARAHTDLRWASAPLSEPTEDGRDTATSYIDYVSAWIGRSEQKGKWLGGPRPYHEWVREYERRRSGPMPSRLEWILRRLPS